MDPVPAVPGAREHPMRRSLFWVAAAVLFVALFHPILIVRGHYYLEQPRYSHCLLLPLVSALWVWDRWDRLKSLPRAASMQGVALLALAVLAFLYGRLQARNYMQHAAMLAAAAGVVWALWGRALLRAVAFPLGYLVLTIPLPKTWDDAITVPLQRVATVMAEGCFDLFGWVVVRQGNVIQLPGLKLLVEEQCSGVHSLYALVALGVAWVAFVPRPRWLQVVLVAATVPVAVLANAVRVVGTGILAYEVDPAYAEGMSHWTAGMVVFAIGLAMLLLVDWCLKPDEPERADDRVA